MYRNMKINIIEKTYGLRALQAMSGFASDKKTLLFRKMEANPKLKW